MPVSLVYFYFTFVLISFDYFLPKSEVSPIFHRMKSCPARGKSNYRESLCLDVFLLKIPHGILKWCPGPSDWQHRTYGGPDFSICVVSLGYRAPSGMTLKLGLVSCDHFTQPRVVLAHTWALPNPDREYNFQRKRSLNLKSLLKCSKAVCDFCPNFLHTYSISFGFVSFSRLSFHMLPRFYTTMSSVTSFLPFTVRPSVSLRLLCLAQAPILLDCLNCLSLETVG